MGNVTIKDIALAAKVSHPTVSKALNGAPGVNPQTRERILALAKQMNYVPNTAAQRLSNKKNRSIGFIWPNLEGLFFYDLCNTLQKEARTRDIDVLISMAEPAKALRTFDEHFIDFILCWFFAGWTPTSTFIQQRENYRGELTILGGGSLENANQVSINREQGILNAMRYLAELGHKKVAFIGMESDKSNGYLKGLLQYGMEYHEEYLITASSFIYNDREYNANYSQRFEKIWNSKSRPTALILDSQGTAFSMLAPLNQLGISIPKDLSVICYDDIPELSIYQVALTTCGPSSKDLIAASLDIYEQYFENDCLPEKRIEVVNPQLVIRDSCISLR